MFEALWRWIKSINKKVWVTAALLAAVFTVGMSWIVVANIKAAFKPANFVGLDERQRQTVSGNGGPAVMVGNWLYFVGGYVDSSTLRYRENEHNKVKDGAIYRVYIDPAEGAPLYEESGLDQLNPDFTPHLLVKSKRDIKIDGADKQLRPYQLIVPKVAGFDQAALWVFDKHLVYTSPNNAKDKYGALQVGKIDFFRVDLDGRNHRKIYTTSNETVTTDKFTVTSYDGNVFLVIHDGDLLRRVSVNGKNPGEVSTVSKEVQNAVLPIVTSYHKDYYQDDKGKWQPEPYDPLATRDVIASYRDVMSHIYYTEAFTEDEQKIGLRGNKLVQYNILKDTKVEVPMTWNTVEVLALSNGRLVYTVQAEGGTPRLFATENIISNDNTDPFDIAKKAGRAKFLDDFLLETYVLPEETVHLPTVHTPGVVQRFVTTAGDKMYFYESGKRDHVATVEDVASIITITGSTVHYLSGGGEFRAADLNNGKVIEGMGKLSPEQQIRPWVIARDQTIWHFYIKTFTGAADSDSNADNSVDDSITTAMLADLANGTREFILGRLDSKYVNNPEDCC